MQLVNFLDPEILHSKSPPISNFLHLSLTFHLLFSLFQLWMHIKSFKGIPSCFFLSLFSHSITAVLLILFSFFFHKRPNPTRPDDLKNGKEIPFLCLITKINISLMHPPTIGSCEVPVCLFPGAPSRSSFSIAIVCAYQSVERVVYFYLHIITGLQNLPCSIFSA